MASTFRGLSLFNSGPHRFVPGASGRSVTFIPPPAFDGGQREFTIRQEGRLIAGSEADLWNQVAQIQAEAQNAASGALIDHHGNTWNNMQLYRFEPQHFVDRARNISLHYTADYIRYT